MDLALIGFLGTCFIGLTYLNSIATGTFIAAGDVAIMNQVMGFYVINVGPFPIPIPNLNFLAGLMHLIIWDYSYFGGQAVIIQYALFSFSMAFQFMLFILMATMAYNVIKR